MNIDLPAGGYVVAVSGGVDSVALMHMLAQRPDLQLTVAHFDHGIRTDSLKDRQLVQSLAAEYNLPFVYHQGNLGNKTSEATAREARYKFLHHVREKSGAQAIVTAHHQNDVLETAILNLLRGTGRRGLSSLKSTDVIKRPLLQVPKQSLMRYAEQNSLRWREDSTNTDDHYLRNYIRLRLLPRFSEQDKQALLRTITNVGQINTDITAELINILHVQASRDMLDRKQFIMLPHAVAREVMAEWLLQRTDAELTSKLLERLVVAAKTGRTNTCTDISAGYWLEINKDNLALATRKR